MDGHRGKGRSSDRAVAYGRAVTPEEFRANAHAVIDWIIDYVEGVEQHPVSSRLQPGEVRAALPQRPPSEREPFAAVLADVDRVIVPGLTHWQHPSFFAYFPGNSTYASLLGEMLSAGMAVQGMSWVTSPACTEVETLMLDWMLELLGLPERFHSQSPTGGGVIHGSASEATLVAILAARWRITGGEVNRAGVDPALVAYMTSQAHSSVEKGLRIAGIGTDQIRIVPHDEAFAMRPEALEAMVAEDLAGGRRPFFVCCTRGTTSSMAFDPVGSVAAVARSNGMWVHVDGAMSGIAALAAEHRWVNDGLELADSYCTNPHKWMGVHFDCDLFWTADRAALLGALSILPEYLRSEAAESGAVIDYRDWQVPLGRRFRSLKLWTTIRDGGAIAAAEMIRHHVDLTRRLVEWIGADDRFEIIAPHPLNLVCVRLRSGDADTDALIEAANRSGAALFTRTVLDDRVALRFSVGGRTTQERHVRAGWELLRSLAPAGVAA